MVSDIQRVCYIENTIFSGRELTTLQFLKIASKPRLEPKPDPTRALPEGLSRAQDIFEPKLADPTQARAFKPDPTLTSLPVMIPTYLPTPPVQFDA